MLAERSAEKPMLGQKLFEVIPEENAVSVIGAILDGYRELGQAGERVGDVLQNMGMDNFREKIKCEA